jgi:hypothetical protein
LSSKILIRCTLSFSEKVVNDSLREKYGEHTVFLGASFLAHIHTQHTGERGHLPERQGHLLPGETTHKRLGIPMFLGEVH